MTVSLLVSVRNLQEARAALDGGADIIDVKDPARGSLGRAQPHVTAEIVELVRRTSPGTIVSAALGEVVESTWSEFESATPARLPSLDLVKSGLSGLHPAEVSWQQQWNGFRRTAAVLSDHTRWVAAAYADHVRSRSPAVLDVLDEGHRIGSPVLLIDTFQKDRTNLLDWVPMSALHHLRNRTRECDMQLALAGRISTSLLPQLLEVDPDIIAVRGAVCEHGQRTATVSRDRVIQLVTALRQAAGIVGAE